MRILAMLFVTALKMYLFIGACRVLSMTYKTFARSVTIKNRRLATVLIARKNTWGIATGPDKRNKLSLTGVFSWLLFLPQVAFFLYDCQVYFATGVARMCSAEETYLALAPFYYIIAVTVKIREADRFQKGEIW